MEPKKKKLESLNIKFETKLAFEELTAEMKKEKGASVTHDEATRNIMDGYRMWRASMDGNLSQFAPSDEKLVTNSLTSGGNPGMIYVSARPEERELVETLLAILRSGTDAASEVTNTIRLLFKELEEVAHVGVTKSKGQGPPRGPRADKEAGREVESAVPRKTERDV